MTDLNKNQLTGIKELEASKETGLKRIPPRYLDVKLEEVEKFRLNKSYYIWGGVGTGKTRIGYGLIKKSLENDFNLKLERIKLDTEMKFGYYVSSQIVFYNFPKMLSYIRNGIGANQKFDDTLSIEDVSCEEMTVIIDDLGAEKFTDWTIETLYQIINERYEKMLPTILISNLSLSELSEKVGDRIASRIAEMCEVVKIDGKDNRIKIVEDLKESTPR